jgi:hypothetical protein
MKCEKCGFRVSINDDKCRGCGHDLTMFGPTKLLGSGQDGNRRLGRRIKEIALSELYEETKQLSASLQDDDEFNIAAILEKRIGRIFLRHASEEEIDSVYEKDVIPCIDELSKDENAKLISKRLEATLKENLGEILYGYYGKWPEIIKMLFAGELVYLLVRNKEVDLSVKMFEFFKVTELAVKKHAERRVLGLEGHPAAKNVDSVLGSGSDDDRRRKVIGEDIPQWFNGNREENISQHKQAFIVLLDMLTGRKKKSNLINARNAGLALHAFGRETFRINGSTIRMGNPYNARGNMPEREELARNLCELQFVRNKKVHEKTANEESEVNKWRGVAYSCLRAIPVILEI